jgi:hypothetical protein
VNGNETPEGGHAMQATTHEIKIAAGSKVWPEDRRSPDPVVLSADVWVTAEYFAGVFNYEAGGRSYTVPESDVATCEPPAADQRTRLNQVFSLVQNDEHWKNPIDAIVLAGEATSEEIRDAVVFYTGSVPTITSCTVPARHKLGLVEFKVPALHVVADGYYRTIGA